MSVYSGVIDCLVASYNRCVVYDRGTVDLNSRLNILKHPGKYGIGIPYVTLPSLTRRPDFEGCERTCRLHGDHFRRSRLAPVLTGLNPRFGIPRWEAPSSRDGT